MSVPVARRIVVGVDFSAESAAALRWACREASLRGAEVHAVHAREAPCHSMASYAVSALDEPDAIDTDVMWRSVMPDPVPGVQVRTEIVEGLAARILLDRSDGADMLILGTASDNDEALRSAGPVIRACLRRALCPVVVISVAQDPMPRDEAAAQGADVHVPVRVPAGVGAGSGTGTGGGVRIPAPAGMGVPAGSAKGVPVPAGA
jgi:nucleotide-binding universal stress UspA family protein